MILVSKLFMEFDQASILARLMLVSYSISGTNLSRFALVLVRFLMVYYPGVNVAAYQKVTSSSLDIVTRMCASNCCSSFFCCSKSELS